MTHHATARPVSGKFMAAEEPGRREPRLAAPLDVVDAEFETVAAAPGRPRRIDDGALSYRPGLDLLGRRAIDPPAAPAERGGRLFWTVGACLVLAAFWMAGGHSAILGTLGTAEPAATSALTLTGVSSRVDHSGARPVILVDGNAGNDGSAPADLPGLEIRVADLDGRVIRYKLGTSSRSLAPGERFAFSSRLEVPKSGVKTVSVTFAQ